MENYEGKLPISDKDAAKVFDDVIKGLITPEEGAARLDGKWAPIEYINNSANVPWAVVREDSIGRLNQYATDLSNQEAFDEATRLARLNLLVAQKCNNETVTAWTMAILGQALCADPNSITERLYLLEQSTSIIFENTAPEQKGVLLFHLADARYNYKAKQAALDAGRAALDYSSYLQDFQLGRLHYIIGTILNEIFSNKDEITSSVSHLNQALQYYTPSSYPHEYGSTLNNLGNSYIELGESFNDIEALKEAIACFEKALEYRDTYQDRRRTQGNKEHALSSLKSLENHTFTKELGQNPSGEYFNQGDSILFRNGLDKEIKDENRIGAAKRYLSGMKILKKDSPNKFKAEGYHRFGILFLKEVDKDACITGLCFLNATYRLGKNQWKKTSLANVNYHQGKLLTQLGHEGSIEYLRKAESFLSSALDNLSEKESPEYYPVELQYTICALVLLERGDNRGEIILRRNLSKIHKLILQKNEGLKSRTSLEVAYEIVLKNVKEIAFDELIELLVNEEIKVLKFIQSNSWADFTKSTILSESAKHRRSIGNLKGALDDIHRAEEFANSCKHAKPRAWISIAEFYKLLPSRQDMVRCIDEAKKSMKYAVEWDMVISSDDASGIWTPLAPEEELFTYEQEINDFELASSDIREEPFFDHNIIAELLYPKDFSGRDTFIKRFRQLKP